MALPLPCGSSFSLAYVVRVNELNAKCKMCKHRFEHDCFEQKGFKFGVNIMYCIMDKQAWHLSVSFWAQCVSAIGQVVGGSAYFVHYHGWCALKVSPARPNPRNFQN